MKRTIALTICVGLASSMAAVAKPKDKEEKREEREQRKAEKAVEKFERKQGRAEDRFERRVENVQAQVAPQEPRVAPPETFNPRIVEQSRAVAQPQIQPEFDANVNTEVRRSRGGDLRRRGPSNFSWSYDEARRYHNRGVRRDRNWYRSNYSRFALFGGGYYYFDRGYWYPAYGYDPAYTTYRFDEPIYGYNSLEPGQVLVNVQRELRRQGYYRGAIDGLIGPMTRAAIARYQRDNGLYVTRAVDGPTLASLGLT
jgi:hypothetical protein